MKKLIKLFVSTFLIGQLASPSMYLFAYPTGVNWSTQQGGSYNTPSNGGTPGAILVNVGQYALDYSTMAPVLPSGGQGFVGAFFVSTGCAITNTTAVSTFSALTASGYGTVTLPANFLVAGKAIRYTAFGTLSTPGTALAGTASFSVKLGTTTVGTTGGVPLPVALSSMTFKMEGILTCIAAGSFVAGVSSATTNFMISVASGTSLTPSNAGAYVIGNSTNNIAQINTTQANDLNLTVQYNLGSAGNVLIINNLVYENLN